MAYRPSPLIIEHVGVEAPDAAHVKMSVMISLTGWGEEPPAGGQPDEPHVIRFVLDRSQARELVRQVSKMLKLRHEKVVFDSLSPGDHDV